MLVVKTQNQNNQTGETSESEYPVPKVSPILKWAIIIMSTLIVAILVIIISTIIYRAVKLGDKGSTKTYSANGFGTKKLDVLPGSKAGEVALNNNKMTIVIRNKDSGDEIVIMDVRSGTVIGRIQLKEK